MQRNFKRPVGTGKKGDLEEDLLHLLRRERGALFHGDHVSMQAETGNSGRGHVEVRGLQIDHAPEEGIDPSHRALALCWERRT